MPTLSAVFDRTPARSERPFIEAVLARGGFEPIFVHADDYAPFADLAAILAEQDGPFQAPGLAMTRQLYGAAAGRGIRILLDGHGGDEVVSHGVGRLAELARSGRWIALWRCVGGIARTYGENPWPRYAAYVRSHGPRGIRSLSRIASSRTPLDADGPAWSRFISPNLAARTGLADRYTELRRAEAKAAASERERHAWTLASGRASQSFEILDRAAAAAGVEVRYPFWDKRLVTFCLSLRSEDKLDGGWSRLVLRRAMEGVLPPSVQWRPDKLDFAPHLIRGILVHHRSLLDRILVEDADGVGAFVHLPAVCAAYRRMAERAEGSEGRDVQAVWRTVVLSTWLRRQAQTQDLETSGLLREAI
jgi:asparagine synthase (glutamine-hydrolysing)